VKGYPCEKWDFSETMQAIVMEFTQLIANRYIVITIWVPHNLSSYIMDALNWKVPPFTFGGTSPRMLNLQSSDYYQQKWKTII
jgi:hypothetical protein